MNNQAALMSSERSDWRTPAHVLELVRQVAGGTIALDPCASDDHTGAACVFTDGGLVCDWKCDGLIYVNPPYGRTIGKWVEKIVEEWYDGAEIIALLPARTDARWWQQHVTTADAICFWAGRLTFVGAPSTAPFPSAIAYWGDRAKVFRRVFGESGWIP